MLLSPWFCYSARLCSRQAWDNGVLCREAPLGKNQYETAGRTGTNGLFQRPFNI
jgi:hypothetical protein